MKYVVDKVEENVAVLENLATGEILEVDLSLLPNEIRESNVLVCNNNRYFIDSFEESSRRDMLKNKFDKLRKKSNE